MQRLKIPYMEFEQDYPELNQVSADLENPAYWHTLSFAPWKTQLDQPIVRFSLGYGKQELFLKYSVAENYLLAEKKETNQAVYQDSCVEFFVQPGIGVPYLNFEFNCIGTCLAQIGYSRQDRLYLAPERIFKIRRNSSLGNHKISLKKGMFEWTLMLAIPFNLFLKKKPKGGDQVKANFYKCGDLLPEVHYLAWNNIETTKPDFHQPDFFGTLEFN